MEDSYLESRALICHVLKIRPATLYSNPEYIINSRERQRLISLINRRIGREPLSYLIGYKEFYGLKLVVNKNVLIPRPETEILVEEAINLIKKKSISSHNRSILMADIGTGSGAISIAIASKIKEIKIYALDISGKALVVARKNINNHNLTGRIFPLRSDLLKSLPEPVDLIIANLPYIKQSEIDNLASEIKDFEPFIALNGGGNGIVKICDLLLGAKAYLRTDGYILLEIGQGQSDEIIRFISGYFENARVVVIYDYSGIARILKICFEL